MTGIHFDFDPGEFQADRDKKMILIKNWWNINKDKDREEWKDVQPVPQDDGPNPVVKIAYTKRCEQLKIRIF